MLKDLKKKEEGDFPFGIEDLLYYVDRIEEQQFNLDLGALKQYFPFNLVMSGILKICQDLFGLRFEEIADAEVWHSDVHLYSVYDLSSSELLGYFYLDMFSREGKYGHTCVVALQNGSFVNGARKIPVALLLSFKRSWSYWVVLKWLIFSMNLAMWLAEGITKNTIEDTGHSIRASTVQGRGSSGYG
ncbi:putative thimet oligopeptidase [Camellia lanceoleosa]|uniref:Thimet oligopeptidase n=1 Tax=Camellia lanceoleosa TaxID=1840588 RepID=A0ACC0GNN2_9ERIC|nr:putative thimet oligopeptidase [Camellia lanceoleosa]